METFLNLLHGLDFLFCYFLVGTAFFYSVVVWAGGPAAVDTDVCWRLRLRLLALLSLVSSTLWMLATASDMAESWSLRDLWQVMSATEFGHLWCLRIAILLLSTILLFFIRLSRAAFLGVFIASLLLALVSAMSGHAGSQETGTAWKVAVLWIHAAAAGVWSGGLFSLFFWLGARRKNLSGNTNLSQLVVLRFSHSAMASTATLLVCGLASAYSMGVPLTRPWSSPYGQLVLAKLLFLSLALAAAAVNQFVHLRNAANSNESIFARRIQREVGLELILVLIIFGIAGFLSRSALPG